MRFSTFSFLGALVCAGLASGAAMPRTAEEYKVLKSVKVGGDGGFDYVYADAVGRKLYIARSGQTARMTVYDLDNLTAVGEIEKTNARGAAADAKSGHGFASSKPVAMWDTKSLKLIKTIDVDGRPDGILSDPFNQRIYILSHSAPNVTVIDAKEGKVLGMIDLGGAPEQAVTDGKGHIYIDLEDKDAVAVVDAKTMTKTGQYSLDGKGGTCAGLALDAKNGVLFVTCRQPNTMVLLDAKSGKVLGALPIGKGTDGAAFNPKTMEAYSSNGDGTLTIIKEKSPTEFVVAQNLTTMLGAKTMTFDSKTGHIILIAAEYSNAATAVEGVRPRRTMVPGSFTVLVVGK